MSDRWTEQLSEYLDQELDAPQRAGLERHLETCSECRSTLEDLKRVAARAHALVDTPPPDDLWQAISARIGASRFFGRAAGATVRRSLGGRRFSFSLPQLAAAGIALVVLSGSAVWLASRRPAGPATLAHATPDLLSSGSVATAGFDAGHYDAEIAQLRQALDQGRDRLDPATVKTLEDNLKIIERAIIQAKRALAADPANGYLRDHLAETMQRKIDLMRRATLLASVQG